MARTTERLSTLWLFGVVWGGCVFSIAGDVTWFDSGEFLTGAAGLGVAHPTGFPLLSLVGFVAGYIPVGPLPFRVACVSGLAVAASTALCYRAACHLGVRPALAWVAACFYPAVYVTWLHATIVEAYALNGLLLAALCTVALAPSPNLRLAAIITGLGLGSHATFVLSAALVWVFLLARYTPWRRLLELVAWGLLGATVILYLPMAASRDPWLLWTDTSTWTGLVEHLTGAGIRDAFADEMGGSTTSWHDLQQWCRNAAGPLGVVLIPLTALGLSIQVQKPHAALVLGLLLVDLLFSVLLNPMGQADLQTGMPGAWCVALGLGLIAGRNHSGWHATVLSWAVVLVFVGSATFEHLDAREEETLAGDWGRSLLMHQDPGALTLTSSDHLSGQALYLQSIEGLRPDICALVIQHLPKSERVERQFSRVGWPSPEPFMTLERDRQAERQDALVRSRLRVGPVYWELGDGRFDSRVASALRPTGGLHRVARDAEEASTSLGMLRSPIQQSLGRLGRPERLSARSRRVIADGARLSGVWHLVRGENDAGARCLEESVELDPSAFRAQLNLAAARFRQRRVEEAIELLEELTEAHPAYLKAWRNLAEYLAHIGRAAEAAEIRDRRL